MVYLSDGYLKIAATWPPIRGKDDEKETKARESSGRFFQLMTKLPMDLQMVLCNRVFDLEDSVIKNIHSERGFKRFSQGW